MSVTSKKQAARLRRQRRTRKKILGTASRPRLSVFRSNRHICVQFIDDTAAITLGSVSTLSKAFRERFSGTAGNVAAAAHLGEMAGEVASGLNIKEAFFDRGGYKYHGRVKALADAVRKAGVKF
jgi:large subunit ribosomal protein L18